MTTSAVSPEEFVRVWQTAVGIKAIVGATGLSYGAVTRRAVDYRRQGIKLKRMRGPQVRPSGRRTIDVNALNKICESIGKAK